MKRIDVVFILVISFLIFSACNNTPVKSPAASNTLVKSPAESNTPTFQWQPNMLGQIDIEGILSSISSRPTGFGKEESKISKAFFDPNLQETLTSAGRTVFYATDGNYQVSSYTVHQGQNSLCLFALPKRLVFKDPGTGQLMAVDRLQIAEGIAEYGQTSTKQVLLDVLTAVDVTGLPTNLACLSTIITNSNDPEYTLFNIILYDQTTGNVVQVIRAGFPATDQVSFTFGHDGRPILTDNAKDLTWTPWAANTETPATMASLNETVSPTFTPVPTSTALPNGLPGSILPSGFGIVTHYGEYRYYKVNPYWNLLSTTDIRFVKDALVDYQICTTTGCNFTDPDSYFNYMTRLGFRVQFFLASDHPVYLTDEGRKSFSEFAAAAAKHYAGKGVIWSIWGEPDGAESWLSEPDPKLYTSFMDQVIAAMREADPSAIIVGPGVSTLLTMYGNPWQFLDAVGRYGFYSQVNAVDVHLYTGSAPESEIPNLLKLRRLIDTYSPNRKIPIVTTEWGYSSQDLFYGSVYTEADQAKFLARSWLVNVANEIYLNIWYAWQDNAWPTINEHFGVINSGQPKPAFYALKTLTTTLDGYQFIRRIAVPSNGDFLLLFRKGRSGILAAWTTGAPHSINFPNVSSNIQSIELLGQNEVLTPDSQGLTLQLTDSVRYLILPDGFLGSENIFWKPDETFLRLDSAWHGEIPITVENLSDQKQSYEFHAFVNDFVIGSLQINIDPGGVQSFNLPVDIKPSSDRVDFFVKILMNSQGKSQSAWVWEQK